MANIFSALNRTCNEIDKLNKNMPSDKLVIIAFRNEAWSYAQVIPILSLLIGGYFLSLHVKPPRILGGQFKKIKKKL